MPVGYYLQLHEGVVRQKPVSGLMGRGSASEKHFSGREKSEAGREDVLGRAGLFVKQGALSRRWHGGSNKKSAV